MPHALWLLLGVFAGYALVMWTNPIRACLRDGLRVMGRYQAIWVLPGVFGFGGACFQLGLRYYFSLALPPETRPEFSWTREGWTGAVGLFGSEKALWHLAPGTLA